MLATLCEVMKIVLFESENIDLTSKEDLALFIPDHLDGKVLNYGQGEGQIEIEGTVWGLYVNNENFYYFTLEEGFISWDKFTALVDSILVKVNSEFGVNFSLAVEGPVLNEPNM